MFGHRPPPAPISLSNPPPYPHPLPHKESTSVSVHATALVQLEHIGKQRTKEIRPGTELRITVGPDEDLFLRAHSRIPDTFATAEVFGMELVMGHEYKVERGMHVAIFSWHGCTIEMRGATTVEYDASNQVMRDYTNCAGIIEQKRQKAEEQAGLAPPRVLITGSKNSGKSTLSLFLANYALRKHRRPIFVELDPGSTSDHRQLPSIPGCVGALHIDHSAYELNQEPVHPNRTNLHKGIDQGIQAAHLNPNYPMGKFVSFWYGHENWEAQREIYWKTIAQLSCLVHAKELLTETQAVGTAVQAEGVKLENLAKGGVIVNAPKTASLELLDEIVRLYEINTIVVIDDEEKYQHFVNVHYGGVPPTVPAMGDDGIIRGQESGALIFIDAMEKEEENALDIAHVAKAGGVINNQSEEWRNRMFHMKFADYFHGPERDLVCHNFSVPLRELFVACISQKEEATGTHWVDKFQVVPFRDLPGKLRHSVLAIVLAPTLDEIVYSTVSGIVWVRDVSDPEDPINAQLHLMSPSASPMMSNYLLHGDLENLKYFEQ